MERPTFLQEIELNFYRLLPGRKLKSLLPAVVLTGEMVRQMSFESFDNRIRPLALGFTTRHQHECQYWTEDLSRITVQRREK